MSPTATLGLILSAATLGLILLPTFLIAVLFREEIAAIRERDPAARGPLSVILIILSYPGLHAIIYHRIAHLLHRLRVPLLPRLVSQTARFLTGIEIHPAARIGRRLFIDHGMGVVIGETAEIGDDVTLFQGVTLGGTGKETGKRHPTLGNHIVVGAGAKILGNIRIGDHVKIGANAVVLSDVPPCSTVVGVPGKIVRIQGCKPADDLDHAAIPDPVAHRLNVLQRQIDALAERLGVREVEQEVLKQDDMPIENL